ncbi:MAG TPA: GNAT family N-acetyltransferase [Bacillota bacterium]|nr:GNAT family N-acetyltransferase [Bacillota bacterium]
MLIFRKAESKDAAELAEMRWDFRHDPQERTPEVSKNEFVTYCREFLQESLEKGDWIGWMAEEDHRIISHVFIKKIRKIPKPNRLKDEYGYVTNVYTRPEFRNKGIGKRLMVKVQEWAREEDLEILIVWPSQASVRFYERMGFSPENEIMEMILREE